jgi:DNA polymerase III epsilon subunit-like protein
MIPYRSGAFAMGRQCTKLSHDWRKFLVVMTAPPPVAAPPPAEPAANDPAASEPGATGPTAPAASASASSQSTVATSGAVKSTSRPLFHYHDPSGTEVLTDRPLAVVDLETTGFAPGGERGDRVIEVAVVRMTPDGRVEDEWVTLLDPGRDVGPTWVHQISQDMVIGAPDFASIAGELLDRLSGAVVVAHNAPFEDGFLGWEFAHAGLDVPRLPALCTMRLARQVLAAPNYKLATCCEAFGLVNDGAHSALGDARVTAELVRQLLTLSPELRWASGPPTLPTGSHGPARQRP